MQELSKSPIRSAVIQKTGGLDNSNGYSHGPFYAYLVYRNHNILSAFGNILSHLEGIDQEVSLRKANKYIEQIGQDSLLKHSDQLKLELINYIKIILSVNLEETKDHPGDISYE